MNVRDVVLRTEGESAHCSNATFHNAHDWTLDVMDIGYLSANEEISSGLSLRTKFACMKTSFELFLCVLIYCD